MSYVVTTGNGTITVPEQALLDLVALAGNSVGGARVRRRRAVSVEARTARVEIAVRRGANVHETAVRVQEAVAAALRTMLGIEATVEIAVEERE